MSGIEIAGTDENFSSARSNVFYTPHGSARESHYGQSRGQALSSVRNVDRFEDQNRTSFNYRVNEHAQNLPNQLRQRNVRELQSNAYIGLSKVSILARIEYCPLKFFQVLRSYYILAKENWILWIPVIAGVYWGGTAVLANAAASSSAAVDEGIQQGAENAAKSFAEMAKEALPSALEAVRNFNYKDLSTWTQIGEYSAGAACIYKKGRDICRGFCDAYVCVRGQDKLQQVIFLGQELQRRGLIENRSFRRRAEVPVQNGVALRLSVRPIDVIKEVDNKFSWFGDESRHESRALRLESLLAAADRASVTSQETVTLRKLIYIISPSSVDGRDEKLVASLKYSVPRSVRRQLAPLMADLEEYDEMQATLKVPAIAQYKSQKFEEKFYGL